VKLLPKMKLEIVAPSDRAEAIMEAVADAARSGKIGDGKIWVCDVESALRIRTGERDEQALVD
jgi:nitrogen regulatory protein P-II 2